MAFAKQPGGVGTGGIEVAQADGFQAVGAVVVGEDLLQHQLAATIGVDWGFGVVLVDWAVVWLAENRGGGGEDKPLAVVTHHRIEQVERVGDVVMVVLLRMIDRLADLDEGGEVEYAVEAVLGEQLV